MMMANNILTANAIALLKQLISTPSFSKEEDGTANLLADFLTKHNVAVQRVGNNVYAFNKYFEAGKPSLLLNSHHDTVKPNKGYTHDPFEPIVQDGKLYGLGSNDAGGCLVALVATFLHFYPQENLPYNIVLAASAEEEISGTNGIEMLLPYLGKIDGAIVGEPTLLQMAVAERGLMVLDCVAPGKSGHAARNEGENALYHALDDIDWIRKYRFERESPILGACRMTAVVINTENMQHNVVPSSCRFVVDVRVNELYTFDEVLDILRAHLKSSCQPRSTRMKSTAIAMDHPLVRAGLTMGLGYYGSPTTSDKALMPFPALKMGPGDSARSHTADEFIYLNEIELGIDTYIELVTKMMAAS